MRKRDTERFDEVDLALLESVESDFDVSLEKLAEELELSKSAVHYRLNKLKENGVITGVTADIDPEPFGLEMVAITEVSVTHDQGYSEEIGTQLGDVGGVEQVYYTMGDVDFVAITRVQNREQMNAVIEAMVGIDGVNETSSRFVMNEIESTPRVLTNMSAESRERLLDEE
jgi:Lrp/AsnC family leucine-responsive transcriptional regulator